MSDLYKSEEWRLVHPIERAMILLVIEGLKKGTVVSGYTNYPAQIKDTGVDFVPFRRVDKGLLVAKSNILDEMSIRLGKSYEGKDRYYFDRLYGWFLGYPECCIEEYIKEKIKFRKKDEERLLYRFSTFGKELTDLVRKDGKYSEVLDYRPYRFVPCKIDCQNLIDMLSSYKATLEKFDSEAAEYLVKFNRKEFYEELPWYMKLFSKAPKNY